MERHRGDAGVGEARRPAVRVGNHQVGVQRHRADGLDALHHRQPDGQVGHKVVVHDVHMHRIGIADPVQFGLKVDEVGREDARVDAALGHGFPSRSYLAGSYVGRQCPSIGETQAFLRISARNMASVRCTCGQSWAVSSCPAVEVAGEADAVQRGAGVEELEVRRACAGHHSRRRSSLPGAASRSRRPPRRRA